MPSKHISMPGSFPLYLVRQADIEVASDVGKVKDFNDFQDAE